MQLTTRPLKDAFQTGRYMHTLVKEYYHDMIPFADYTMDEMFWQISSLPFVPDPPNIEFVKRSGFTMNRIGPGGDCDDKAVAMASWAVLNSIPYRFVGVGRKIPGKFYFPWSKVLLTHVFSELYIMGEWLLVDATYSQNILGNNLGGYDRRVILNP